MNTNVTPVPAIIFDPALSDRPPFPFAMPLTVVAET